MMLFLFSLLMLKYEIVIIPPAREPVMAIVTAYTGNPNETDDSPNENASGQKPKFGDVACPRSIALGTKVKIGDIGTFTCRDRMNKRYGDGYFDVFAGTGPEAERAAKVFGKQLLEIKLL